MKTYPKALYFALLAAESVVGSYYCRAWSNDHRNFLYRRSSSALFASTAETSTSRSNITLNPLISLVKPSKTVEIFSMVKQLEAEGMEITSLCVGEPDYPPPKAVIDALVKAASTETRYTAVSGTVPLRKAIADDLFRRKKISYNPTTEIVVANGAKQAIFQALLAVAGVGDKVLVPAPHWPYPDMVKLTGATPVIVQASPEAGYLLTPDQLRQALSENSPKLLILCNPSNPTGGVYGHNQLAELVSVLQSFPDVLVLSDEIYDRLVYDGGDAPALASFPGMWHRTMTINGFSKSHAMTGLRVGYVAAPAPLAKAITTIQSQVTSCASSLSQAAAVAALTLVDESELEKNVVVMQEKRDYVVERLRRMPGVRVAVPPQGAFYVLPEIDTDDDTQLCIDLLQSKQLALVPGCSFGAPGTVRISYAASMETLQVAMDKLESFMREKLQGS